MKCRKSFCILVLAAALPLSASPSAQEERKRRIDKAPKTSVTHFTGSDVPDFWAWKSFFDDADHVYRLGTGYYKNWIKSQLAIGPLLEADPKLSEQVRRILPDQGMLLQRESERLQNEIGLYVRMRDRGEMARQEQHRRFLELTRQEVRLVQKAHEQLHALILSSPSPQRKAIWKRIVEYVHEEVKDSISITMDNTPGDFDHLQVLLEFREVGK